MKNVSVLSLIGFALFCFFAQPVFSQGPDLAALDIGAIKSIQLDQDDAGYYADVEILIQNKGDKAVKLKNMDFDVSFKEGGQVLPLGKAPIKELIIPPGSADTSESGEKVFKLSMTIGPKTNQTVGRLIHLFNIIGNPSNSLIMVLEGTGEFGTKVEKGWIYHTGMKAELEFVPSIQREILFK